MIGGTLSGINPSTALGVVLSIGSATPTPTINAVDEAPEHTVVNIAITNWNAERRYNVVVDAGTVSHAGSGVYEWLLPFVVADTDHFFDVYAEAYGELVSQTTSYKVTVLDGVTLVDVTIVNNDFETNEYDSGGVTHGATDMVFDTHGSYVENMYTQTVDVADWASSTTTVITEPQQLAIVGSSSNELVIQNDEPNLVEIVVDGASDADYLVTPTKVVEGDEAILTKADNSFVDGSLGVVTVDGGLVSSTDPFDWVGNNSNPKLVAKYQLDNNANDTTGNYAGTPSNVTYGTGKFDDAGVFNGSSSTITTSGSHNIGTDDFVASVWIKTNTTPAGTGYVFTNRDTSSIDMFTLRVNSSNNVFFTTYDGSAESAVTGTIDVVDDAWHNIIVKRVGGLHSIYVDGVLDKEETLTVKNIQTSESYKIGSNGIGTVDSFFAGSIDQVEMYAVGSNGFTQSNIDALYNQNSAIYTADITSFILGEVPTAAHKGELTDPVLNKTIGIAKADYTDDYKTVDSTTVTYSGSGKVYNYAVDITDISLLETPTTGFLLHDKTLTTQVQSEAGRIVGGAVEFVEITDARDNAGDWEIDSAVELIEGGRINVDGVSGIGGGVAESIGNAVSAVDILGDGSGTYLYSLDSTSPEVSGSFTGTSTDMSVITGEFSDGLAGTSATGMVDFGTGSEAMYPTDNSYTISIWIKRNDATREFFFGNSDFGGADGDVVFWDYDNNITVYSYSGLDVSNTNVVASKTGYDDGNWHHLVVVRDRDTGLCSIYLDDVLQTKTTTNTIPTTGYLSARSCRIGNGRNGGSATLTGVDQLRIFNKALTLSEVSQINAEELTLYTQLLDDPVFNVLATEPSIAYRLGTAELTKASSTTTQFVGTHANTGMLVDGDKVVLDGVEVDSITVVESVSSSLGANNEFETYLDTGNGSGKVIVLDNITTGVDFIWRKERDGTHRNWLFDSVRGVGLGLSSNETYEEKDGSDSIEAFNSNGFDIGANTLGVQMAGEINVDGKEFVSWCASLPNHTPANTDGSITSEVKANSFMSVVSYTGTGAVATVGHGLATKPQLILAKSLANATAWVSYDETTGATNYMFLNETTATTIGNQPWGDIEPTADVFTLNTSAYVNPSSSMIAYCFTSVAGVCKVGGILNSNGTLVEDCGFEPAFVMVKSYDTTGNWLMFFSDDESVVANDSQASNDSWGNIFNFTSTGFEFNGIGGDGQGDLIYLAIAKGTLQDIPQYEVNFADFGSSPTTCGVADRGVADANPVHDGYDGTIVNTTYDEHEQTGRALRRTLIGETGLKVVEPLSSAMKKYPYRSDTPIAIDWSTFAVADGFV